MKKLIVLLSFCLTSFEVFSQFAVLKPVFGNGDTTFQGKMYFADKDNGYFCASKLNGGLLNATQEIYKTTDGGANWLSISSNSRNGSRFGIDGKGKDTLFVSISSRRIIRSFNGGNSWDTVLYQSGKPTILSTSDVFVAGEDGIYYSNNWGTSFTKHYAYTTPFLALDFFKPDTMCAFQSLEKKFYQSIDSGKTWSFTGTLTDSANSINYVVKIIGPNKILAGLGSSLYLSMDAGTTWTRLKTFDKNFDIHNDGIIQINQKDFLLAHNRNLYKSNNGGHNWCKMSASPSGQYLYTNVSEMYDVFFIDDSTGFWTYGTNGSSGTEFLVTTNQGGPACPSSPGTGMEETKVSNGLRVYPNPSAGQFRLSLESGNLKQLEVYSASGQLILTRTLQGQSGEFSLKSTPGLYLVRVLDDQGIWRQHKVLVN